MSGALALVAALIAGPDEGEAPATVPTTEAEDDLLTQSTSLTSPAVLANGRLFAESYRRTPDLESGPGRRSRGADDDDDDDDITLSPALPAPILHYHR